MSIEQKGMGWIGLLSILLVTLIAVVLLAVDTADKNQIEEGIRAVPTETQQIDKGEVTPSPSNETPVADPSGPYQPQ